MPFLQPGGTFTFDPATDGAVQTVTFDVTPGFVYSIDIGATPGFGTRTTFSDIVAGPQGRAPLPFRDAFTASAAGRAAMEFEVFGAFPGSISITLSLEDDAGEGVFSHDYIDFTRLVSGRIDAVGFDFTGHNVALADVDSFHFLAEAGETYRFVPSGTVEGLRVSVEGEDARFVAGRDTVLEFTAATDGLRTLTVTGDSEGIYGISPTTTADRALGDGLRVGEARLVALLYEAGLNRNGAIDLPGLNYWIDQVEAGLSTTGLARAFLFSPEFAQRNGRPDDLTNRELVETLYENVLDRPGEPEGVAFWTRNVSDPGFSRLDLLIAFADSPENRQGSTFVFDLVEASPGYWDFIG